MQNTPSCSLYSKKIWSWKISGICFIVLAKKPEPCFLSLPEQRGILAVCSPGRKMMLRASSHSPLLKGRALAVSSSSTACLTWYQENCMCNPGNACGLPKHIAESAAFILACMKPAGMPQCSQKESSTLFCSLKGFFALFLHSPSKWR